MGIVISILRIAFTYLKSFSELNALSIEELKTFEEQLSREEIKFQNKPEREYRRLAGLLRRNPNAVSKRHTNELSELLKLTFREKISRKNKINKRKGKNDEKNKNEK